MVIFITSNTIFRITIAVPLILTEVKEIQDEQE